MGHLKGTPSVRSMAQWKKHVAKTYFLDRNCPSLQTATKAPQSNFPQARPSAVLRPPHVQAYLRWSKRVCFLAGAQIWTLSSGIFGHTCPNIHAPGSRFARNTRRASLPKRHAKSRIFKVNTSITAQRKLHAGSHRLLPCSTHQTSGT